MTNTPDATELVCTCCLILLVNGDESGCRDFDNHVDGSDDHPHAPMSLLPVDTSPGILWAEHECADDAATVERRFREGGTQCECETVEFSTLPCAGCGTRLHGTRHKVTTWIQG